MTDPLKSYGFNYDHDGKKYAFDAMEEEAKRRVASMSKASFAGELRYADVGLSASSEISQPEGALA